ncbi:MAG: sensor histidine kinase [Nocardioidaceae bacterium]
MSAALIGVAGIVASVAVQVTDDDRLSLAAVGFVQLLYIAVGMVILRAHPGHLVGRLVLLGGAIAGGGTGLLELSYARLRDHPADPTAGLGATLGATGRGFGWLLVVLVLPQIFPDGRRGGPRRLAPVAWWISLSTVAIFAFTGLFSPDQTDLRISTIDNPIGLPHRLSGITDALMALQLLFAVLTIALAITCLVSRWRHGGELRRQQLLWFGLAFAPPIAVFVLSFTDSAAPWMFGVASLPVPVAIGIAVLQHRLYDVNLVLNRSLTYGALWLLIAALYAVTVGGVGAMLRQEGAGWVPWVAAGVVAVSFAPLRDALQRAANKLTYGRWSQPAEVLAATGRRLSDATDVPGLLRTLADELGDGLGLAYVEITDADRTSLARRGEPPSSPDELPLQAYGAPVGSLRWSLRPLREADRRLLSDVAGQLGAVVHAAGLVREIRANQERLVMAREEERKRLRRDLHDGLGPALAGLTLQVDTLRNRLDRAADEGLLGLRSGIASTVLDVRRIVEGLRPPAIDELGLAEALTQLAGRLTAHGGPSLTVCVEAEGLSAAVEVAVYRIAQEAVTNATRHAGAAHVTVDLAARDGALELVVCDDGSGVLRPREGGVGLNSMRERAEEVGGSLLVDAAPGRGTTVTARLPVAQGVPS